MWTSVYFQQLLCLCDEKYSLLSFILQTDFLGWILNAVKHDRVNIILVDFLNRIYLTFLFVLEALFSLTFIVDQLKFL